MELENMILKAQGGEKKYIEEILKRFAPLVIKYSKSVFIAGYEDEDLMQIGYLSIIKAINKYSISKGKNFTAYVMLALRNNFYYEIRQKCRANSEVSLNKPIMPGIELGDELISDINIEEQYLLEESNREVALALQQLSMEERELIEFIYYKGKSLKEYSKLKAINYITCAKRKERALKKLKVIMKLK